jgi:hypothetical protein
MFGTCRLRCWLHSSANSAHLYTVALAKRRTSAAGLQGAGSLLLLCYSPCWVVLPLLALRAVWAWAAGCCIVERYSWQF